MSRDPLGRLTFPLDFVEWAQKIDRPGVTSLGEGPDGEWVLELELRESDYIYMVRLSAQQLNQFNHGWVGPVDYAIRRGFSWLRQHSLLSAPVDIRAARFNRPTHIKADD